MTTKLTSTQLAELIVSRMNDEMADIFLEAIASYATEILEEHGEADTFSDDNMELMYDATTAIYLGVTK